MVAPKVSVSKIIGRAGARLPRSEAVYWLEKLDRFKANAVAVGQPLSSPLFPQVGSLVIAKAGLGIEADRVLLRSRRLGSRGVRPRRVVAPGIARSAVFAVQLHYGRGRAGHPGFPEPAPAEGTLLA